MTHSYAGHPGLAAIPAASRAAEVGRHALDLQFRGAIHFGGGAGNILPLAAMTAFQSYTPTAAQRNAFGIAAPPAGETYTIIFANFIVGAPFRNMFARCAAPACVSARFAASA